VGFNSSGIRNVFGLNGPACQSIYASRILTNIPAVSNVTTKSWKLLHITGCESAIQFAIADFLSGLFNPCVFLRLFFVQKNSLGLPYIFNKNELKLLTHSKARSLICALMMQLSAYLLALNTIRTFNQVLDQTKTATI
jgi:hypothetical protein